MVHVLGVQLPDYQYARFALTAFYGIGHKTAHRLCARLQIHDKCKFEIESEARRVVKDNIAHQRMIGSYVGKRHAMGLPVRGQNTQNNARTAKKLNRVDRRG
ncbi:uncharacterized protein BJ212DRAFT_1450189 [Suillus subaureus]|uniref:Small ribosomal subunit protein uS13m n=1 Tax=Suillus subaureus TaxID=48587 RepID=A0A9P7J2Y3_9AGAM|nr:uncharacterized protein BJ212DRAFT_1450189 [Suillus subaureus]KAG1800143.1 hypothetical protein BJ212DRAFT_1450189 [Suillus subaureus]